MTDHIPDIRKKVPPGALGSNAGLGLVARLRRWPDLPGLNIDRDLLHEAADEIERLRAALDAKPRMFRAALLEEAAQWTGDYRVPVHRGLCDAAKRARVPLTMDDCYRAARGPNVRANRPSGAEKE